MIQFDLHSSYKAYIFKKKASQEILRSLIKVGDESRLVGRTPDLQFTFYQFLDHFSAFPFLDLMFARHRFRSGFEFF